MSSRICRLITRFANKRYRDAYIASHTRIFLGGQMTALRQKMSQKDFGALLGKTQSEISQIEDPHYGELTTLRTLFHVAEKLDIALIVRFVDYPTFLRITDDFSQEALRPEPYDEEKLSKLISNNKEKA
jgi:transcriptional regulator with XRE-family HTH domain